MFIFHNETTLEDLGNGVTRRILAHGGNMMAVEVNFDAGAIGPMHNHPHEQLTYVLSGEFEFTIGEEKRVNAFPGAAAEAVTHAFPAGILVHQTGLNVQIADHLFKFILRGLQ